MKHCISQHGHTVHSQLYTRLYLKDTEQVQAAVHRMEQCLVDVKSWMVDNNLKLNHSKTEELKAARKQQSYKKILNCFFFQRSVRAKEKMVHTSVCQT